MAYGFNDDKSKVEVITKGDFVVIDFVVSNVSANDIKARVMSATDLLALGIDDIDNYVIVSFGEKRSSGAIYYYPSYQIVGGSSPGYRPQVTPEVTVTSSGGLQVIAYNVLTEAADMEYRLVLMRIAN